MAAEREYIAFLYRRLDAERAAATGELGGVLRDASTETTEDLWQREVATSALSARIGRLRVADSGLCFGRLDRDSGEVLYIGRIGLFDEEDDYRPLLTDWRAPVARPFYTATAANSEGVTRRRHFRTRHRRVLDFHDDVLDHGVADGDEVLLAALNAPRADTMGDIVATIQAEQDEIIRLGHTGVVVIDGGPGTGKTVVALHRVAYLLYAHRERMSRRGVLIVGPNTGFLRYIGDVLPSLGETDAVFATPGELHPGLETSAADPPDARRVKGGLAMVDVLTAAVADRQELPETPIEIELDDVTVTIDAEVAGRARARARAAGVRHNQARPVFRDSLILELAEQAVDRIGGDWLDAREVPELAGDLAADVRSELSRSRTLSVAVDRLWPRLTPYGLLVELYGSPERLAAACDGILTPADRDALYREAGSAWTVSDVPLLDEAVELIGPLTPADGVTERMRRRAERRYARDVLTILDTDEDPDGEVLRAVDLIDSERLAERQEERDHRTLAERAAADREWTYGHVVVDEAQELSEMDWRVVMRRCPSRSMTIVGDLAQRESPAGARTWASMLDAYVPGRWTYRRLTINYRMPAEIMEVAGRVLSTMDSTLPVPRSVRHAGELPWARACEPDELSSVVASLAGAERPEEGTLAVLVPEGLELDVDHPVLTPRQAKGLEYDVVIIVEPQRVLAAEPAGVADLYVALTRATQRLGVVHTEPLPAVLDGLRRLDAEVAVR
ncbi:ATP-binding domain-containing protein [Actinophytocola xanthii]|uniref:Helicase n=1 Tax=Actinophytocola xanthii TaxID=1912961 RepID=A0A1Q8CU90_9PSEU|nr:ATP-binding domain-containing protein [Actinophytocola xanthii]OLF17916.1 helicase [Actinophytocola xanthii]